MQPIRSGLLFALTAAMILPPLRAGEPTVVDLWPNGTPGEKMDVGPEQDMTKPTDGLVAGKPVIRLGNVTRPTITIYRPAPGKDTGAAVMVCPGGGYSILAMDLEGTEVCEWLNSIGVTSILLKYRVPKPKGQEINPPALQDAQRALGLIRARAQEFSVDPKRIGVLGFSAGGHLSASLSNNYQERSYPVADEADKVSCRPDFTVLIYPGYLTTKKDNDKISPDLKISTNIPPTFLAMAEDDPVRVENALFYALALKNEKVPVELHIYPSGGHGYGLRPSTHLVATWPQRVEDWMKSQGLFERK